ncbi:type I phosphomannose isomerase catalytic subunit [Mucisphaera calidilacus]|uniref:Putative mannose-6-phosphate isomerase GmuF n=1 Tax=Mucisphaera calidilacus TaxID=2527982 RepID=A0A518BX90_9BACT|nr:type I phosphomannose isomerase catalytic subunit [Mucisphaera calidilacus]QDU71587.1 putative mannose-6-phosphate isomerase GmuF [Mucisphaera calidilacus]
MSKPELYPLRFQPIYKEKVWGGRTLERLGRDLPGDATTLIGESWEIADLAQTSASGGGGNPEHSVIVNGPLAGQRIDQVIRDYTSELMGSVAPSPEGGFPLLIKFLDARENLSVQVHPSPEYASKHPDAHLKSEAWYILDCEPGAVIYKGVMEGVTPERFRQAIEDDAVRELMIEIPVKPGDCHYLPSGTCHALGQGVLVAEVQTPSDTTFRVYDWGRTGRELHLDQAIECIHFGPAETSAFESKAPAIKPDQASTHRLVSCDYFGIDRVHAPDGFEDSIAETNPTIWMILSGSGRFEVPGQEAYAFAAGQTWLVPPDLGDGWAMVEHEATWLEVTFGKTEPIRMA